MADWNKVQGEGNVEDRRTVRPGVAVGGIGGLVLVLAVVFLSGRNQVLDSVLGQLTQDSSQTQTQSLTPSETAYRSFASKVLASNNDIWPAILQAQGGGAQYNAPRLVLFRQATSAACGTETSSVGPNYCNQDQTVYLDETFFDSIYKRFGGSTGDVAQAYVISHEVGHHIQNLLGTLDKATSDQSVQIELQADCYAGIWAKNAASEGIISQSEIQQAVSTAASVGDDNVEKQTTGTVRPDTFTHGTSAQRVQWLNTGYNQGTLAACTTTIN